MNRRKFIKNGLLWTAAAPAIFVPKLIHAQGMVPNRRKNFTPAAGGSSCSYDLCETFENASSGYDNSGWTEYIESPGTGTTINPKNTSSPLTGAQSLTMVSTGIYDYHIYRTANYASGIYVYFQHSITATGSGRFVVNFVKSGATSARVGIRTSNIPDLYCGTTNDYNSTTLTANVLWHFWVYYKQGSGANGEMEMSYSTSNSRPTSGGSYTHITTGNGTNDVDAIWFMGTAGLSSKFDELKISASGYPSGT